MIITVTQNMPGDGDLNHALWQGWCWSIQQPAAKCGTL